MLTADCESDLAKIELIINALGQTNNTVPYLTKYAVIKACGTIEQCFKAIVCDYQIAQHPLPVKNYINETFRNSSMNPSYENICKSLKKFDDNWNQQFKDGVNGNVDSARLKNSLQSLNNSRNTFAHGGSPNVTFADIQMYYADCKVIMEILDAILT